jgi:hypothetical protein
MTQSVSVYNDSLTKIFHILKITIQYCNTTPKKLILRKLILRGILFFILQASDLNIQHIIFVLCENVESFIKNIFRKICDLPMNL